MAKNQPILDDLLTLGGSLLGNLLEARHDFKSQAKSRVDSLARKLDLVSREEFDAAFAMLAKARTMQDDLAERLAQIEEHLNLGQKSRAGKNKKAGNAPLPSLKQGKQSRRRK